MHFLNSVSTQQLQLPHNNNNNNNNSYNNNNNNNNYNDNNDNNNNNNNNNYDNYTYMKFRGVGWVFSLANFILCVRNTNLLLVFFLCFFLFGGIDWTLGLNPTFDD